MWDQKGFIQIPLLIAILIASVSVASVGAGVVLHKQGKLASLTADISEVFKQTEDGIITTEAEKQEEKKLQTETNLRQNQTNDDEQIETQEQKEKIKEPDVTSNSTESVVEQLMSAQETIQEFPAESQNFSQPQKENEKKSEIISKTTAITESSAKKPVCVSSQEICDGKDNDCDNEIDENITRNCGISNIGACQFGTQVCVKGSWGECVGAIESVEEICDQKDNDCDGQIDEENVCGTQETEANPCVDVNCPVCQYCSNGDCVARPDSYNDCGSGCQRCVSGSCQDYNDVCSECQYCSSDICVNYCQGEDSNCGCVNCVNCNINDGCVGNDYYDYFCDGTSCEINITHNSENCIICGVCQYYSNGSCQNYCDSIDIDCGCASCVDCNHLDSWVDIGHSYPCCDGDETCTCQKQDYRDYYCSEILCNYSVVNTKISKSSCVECGTSEVCSDGICQKDYSELLTIKGSTMSKIPNTYLPDSKYGLLLFFNFYDEFGNQLDTTHTLRKLNLTIHNSKNNISAISMYSGGVEIPYHDVDQTENDFNFSMDFNQRISNLEILLDVSTDAILDSAIYVTINDIQIDNIRNKPMIITNLPFTNLTPLEIMKPIISNIQVSNITTNSAIISFDTDKPSSIEITHTAFGNCGRKILLDFLFSTNHHISLTGLLPGTIYYYQISAFDKNGNTSVSDENSFSAQLENIVKVPTDYLTIQAAINAVKSGDNIKIAPGIYYENITLKNGVSIYGEDKDNTIIDGRNNGHTIKAANNSTIQYLTIQNSGKGWDSEYETHFSGIFSVYKSPKILLNNIQNNGDGIYIYGADGLVNETLIMYNNIHDNSGDYATGIMINNGYATTKIKCNLIKNNRLGVQVHRGTSEEIEHNTIVGGTYSLFLSGEAKPYIRNNIFYGWKDGYGVYAQAKPSIIEYNDIYNCQSAPANFYLGLHDGYLHNKFEDPLFVSDSDYHLEPNSPCINAGKDSKNMGAY